MYAFKELGSCYYSGVTVVRSCRSCISTSSSLWDDGIYRTGQRAWSSAQERSPQRAEQPPDVFLHICQKISKNLSVRGETSGRSWCFWMKTSLRICSENELQYVRVGDVRPPVFNLLGDEQNKIASVQQSLHIILFESKCQLATSSET